MEKLIIGNGKCCFLNENDNIIPNIISNNHLLNEDFSKLSQLPENILKDTKLYLKMEIFNCSISQLEDLLFKDVINTYTGLYLKNNAFWFSSLIIKQSTLQISQQIWLDSESFFNSDILSFEIFCKGIFEMKYNWQINKIEIV